MNMNEVESCYRLVNSMRVPELKAVLQPIDRKLCYGRKQELIDRITMFLLDEESAAQTCQRIREITRTPSLNPQQGGMRQTPFNQYQRMPQHPAYYAMRPNLQQHHPQQSYANAFMPGQMSTSSSVPVVMPSRTGGRAEKMQITRLPFFDVIGVVLKMSELTPLNGRNGEVRSIFTFQIQPEHIPLITYRGDQPTPRYEVQLRMFLYDSDIEQADDFPPNCSIKVDDNPVVLPAFIPRTDLNAEQKHLSRPVDITQRIQLSPININRPHKVEIEWSSDRQTWAVGVWLVHRQNANILLERLLTTGIRRSVDETKKKIAVMLDGDDDNIALDQLKISLLCPLMKTRMKIPARTKTCAHLQCFDLLNYLNMNEKRPSWKCPQCNGNAHYDNLIIDQYFMDLLKAVEQNVVEVELERDGNWKILEVACEAQSDDEDDIGPTKAIKIEETPTTTSKSNKPSKKDDADIITLDDSDDDTNTPGSSEPASARTIPFPSSVTTNLSSVAPTPPRTPPTTAATTTGTSVSSKSVAATSGGGGPKAKQGKTNSRRRRSSVSSSSSESSDDNHSRRRKIPQKSSSNGKSSAAATTSQASSSKKVNVEVITIDSSDDEENNRLLARMIESTSPTYFNGYSNGTGNGGRRSTYSNPFRPQMNVSTNGSSATTTKRQNGVHSDIAQRNSHFSSSSSSSSRISDEIEYEVADGLRQFITTVFLRGTHGSSTFTSS